LFNNLAGPKNWGTKNYSKSIFEGKYYAKPATGRRDQLCHQSRLSSVRAVVLVFVAMPTLTVLHP
jgi:hypothetical protein